MPALAYEIPSVGGTGPVKSFFDPASGHRETVEITPIGEEGGHRFRGTGAGFSRYPLESHLLSMRSERALECELPTEGEERVSYQGQHQV